VRDGAGGTEFVRNREAALYFMDMAETEINRCFHDLIDNDDDAMRRAARAALEHAKTLPNDHFAIPESSPVAAGTGRAPPRDGIQQFPGEAK